MKYLKFIIDLISKEQSFLKNIFIILIMTRLLFLEDNQLALLAEIVGGLVVIFTTSPTAIDD
jgi:hypothetical protein